MNFNTLWNLLRKLPIAKYVKPLWKNGLKQAVQIGGDELQVLVKAEAGKGLAGALVRVSALIDNAQKRLRDLAWKVPMLASVRADCDKMLGEGIDDLQEQLEDALEAGSIGAVNQAIDKAFDRFQAQLIARIDAL